MNKSNKTMVMLTIIFFISAGISTVIAEEKTHQISLLNSNTNTLIPDLVYSPTSHDFGNVGQGQTYQTTFEIWNGGTGTLTWNLGIVHTWISPDPTSGSSTGPTDKTTITVTIDTTGLSLGPHSGFVSISANDGGGMRYFNIDCNVVSNNPPHTPSQLSGPTFVEEGIWYEYSTSTTDPDGDEVKYGFDFNNDDIIDPDDWTTYCPSGYTININFIFFGVGTRHIRVKAEDVHGAQSGFSPPLTVTVTAGNDQPDPPAQPSGPSNGLIGETYSYSTSTTDPDDDEVTYGWDWNGNGTVDEWSAYHDSGDTCLMSHIWYNPGVYQVKVKAKDEHGIESEWSTSFTITITAGNNPPDKPDTPTGQQNGRIHTSYIYTTSSEDPDDDQLWYKWDFGDEVSVWDGPYNSGDTVTVSHQWPNQGSYIVKVIVKDSNDAMSVWSDPLTVTMPKNKQKILIFDFLEDVFHNHPDFFFILHHLFIRYQLQI